MATGRTSLRDAQRAKLCHTRGYPGRGRSGTERATDEQLHSDRSSDRVGDRFGQCPAIVIPSPRSTGFETFHRAFLGPKLPQGERTL